MRVRFATGTTRVTLLLAALLLVGLAAPATAQINPRVKIIDGSQAGYARAAVPAAATNAYQDTGAVFADEDDDSPLAPLPPGAPAAPQADPISASSSEPGSLATLHQQSLIDESSWGAESSGSCPDGCCDHGTCSLPSGGGGAACTPCYPCGLLAGVEATYLRLTDNEPGEFTDAFAYQAAPRVWLGWQRANGWGLRGRYWQYGTSQSGDLVEFDVEGYLGVTQSVDVDLFAADVELTRAFTLGRTEYCAGFGLRSGRLQDLTTQHFSLFDLGGGGGDDATFIELDYDRDFTGTGITTSIGFRRPLFDSPLALICNLRGSAIWGGNDLAARIRFVEVVPVGVGDLDVNDEQDLSAFGSNNRGMWISELQAGGEWSAPIRPDFGGGNAVLRLMFEGQWWNLPGVTTTGNFPDGINPAISGQLYELLGFTAAVAITR